MTERRFPSRRPCSAARSGCSCSWDRRAVTAGSQLKAGRRRRIGDRLLLLLSVWIGLDVPLDMATGAPRLRGPVAGAMCP